MKTIILSAAFLSLVLWKRDDGTEIDPAKGAKTYGKICAPFDIETKKMTRIIVTFFVRVLILKLCI